MTLSSKSNLFGVNDWQQIYKTYSQSDFSSYDVETLRKSFIDFLKASYPETFNDYTQGSEYMALLNVIAFMGQSLAFRHDLNTRENFLELAEKRDNVLKLASLVNYTPKRNQCAQGILKITSIRTTENVYDLNGYNLNGQTIIWNDPANPNWFEQFCSIINASLITSQQIGKPGNIKTILGIKTDEYSIQLPSSNSALPVKSFETKVQGAKQRFELVSVSSVGQTTLKEVSPKPNSVFNIIHQNDKLGYASPTNGFFVYFKQGQLLFKDFNVTQQSQNLLVDINQNNINDSDVWLFQIDPIDSSLTEWTKVESVYATNSSTSRNLYSVKSRSNDQISLKFGDGVFSDLPSGKFRALYRVSNGLDYQIAINEMQGIQVSFDYIDATNVQQQLTLQLSLQLPVTNATTAESLTDIKQRAPKSFYSQNRMVNGEDYSLLPFSKYNTILKSKSINRTSIGVSRSKDLLDPTGKYSSHIVTATDGGIFKIDEIQSINVSYSDVTDLAKFFTEDIRKLLSTPKLIQWYQTNATRYTPTLSEGSDTDNKIYWMLGSVQSNNFSTGYFYDYIGSDENLIEHPLATGIYSDNNLKYVGQGALVKITAPTGYYFDVDTNKLKQGTITNVKNGKTYFWATVTNVIEDGYNNGQGLLSTGEGPITLSEYVPDGAIITQVIPSLDNTLGSSLIQNIINRMNLQRDFSLAFNNSLPLNQERWQVSTNTPTNWFFKFTCQSSGNYVVEYRSLKYMFASVRQTRFTFNSDQIVYDRLTGQILNDTIKILRTNLDPDIPTKAINEDIVLTCVGQEIETDGYGNDFQIEVASLNKKNKQFTSDPDFFTKLIGVPSKKWVFFQTTTDPTMLVRKQLISTDDVVYEFATELQIERVKYDYPPSQVFYAYGQDKFFISQQDTTVNTTLNLVETTDYSVATGRNPFTFQYQHYANQNLRVNPSTSNIVDVYVVLKTYYQNYKNWLQDTTGKTVEPTPPTIYELMSAFNDLNQLKTSSDELIFNSVKFKPLFGKKASPNLQAKIKVTKLRSTTASDSEIRSAVVSTIDQFFSIENLDFGQTFYFSELAAFLHSKLSTLISSAIIVPIQNNKMFGELYEIRTMPFEICLSAAQVTDVEVIDTLTPSDLKTSQ